MKPMKPKRSWIVPSLLTGVVLALVFSTRRSSPTSSTPATIPTRQPESRQQPGTSAPSEERRSQEDPLHVLEPGSILDVYQSLKSAMQANIRSVDSKLLQSLSRQLRVLGHRPEAVIASNLAQCAREVAAVPNDPDFFPLSCASPNHVIRDQNNEQASVATAKLLVRYVDAMNKTLHERDIPESMRATSIDVASLNVLIRDLENGNLLSEASNLRARKNQLFKQKFDHSIQRLRIAQPGEEINREARAASDLDNAGYAMLIDVSGRTLYQAINDRKAELSSRSHICSVQTGCFARDGYSDTATVLKMLPNQTRVTVKRAEGAWSLVSFDRLDNGPREGWVLTQALTPIAAA